MGNLIDNQLQGELSLDEICGDPTENLDSICREVYFEGDHEHHLNVNAWRVLPEQMNDPVAANFFPETNVFSKQDDVAVGFSGGGPRGFLCAVGYLSGFRELNVLHKIKYLGGIGGSSWAVLAFTYSQLEVSDAVLLGELIAPHELTPKKLNKVVRNCMRTSASRNIVQNIENMCVKGRNLSDVWSDIIFDAYLRPYGIKNNHYFAYNEEQLGQIKSRNPHIVSKNFHLPANKNRPFPIVGTSIIGPAQRMPMNEPFFNIDRDSFYFLEMTPLYFGNFWSQSINYDFGNGKQTVVAGGAVEPIGCFIELSQFSEQLKGLGQQKLQGTLSIPKPSRLMDLKGCIAASSYAPEELIDPEFIMKAECALSLNHWSCVPSVTACNEMFFADGGYTQSICLISFLQRRVKKIILFFESSVPLKSSKEWDVESDVPESNQVDVALSSYFGICPPKISSSAGMLCKNQVFSAVDFITVMKGLQEAQDKEEPIMYTTNLVTIENSWWGIPAGVKSQITFSYLGHVKSWEKMLPQDTQKQLQTSPEFKNFPFFPESFCGISTKNSNLLCNMAGWTITQNKELFETIFENNSPWT